MKILALILLVSTKVLGLQLNGVATSLDGKKKIYTEAHEISVDEKGQNKKIETKYYDTENKLIAEMVSDFSKNPTIPEIKFTDKRFDLVEELEFKENSKDVIQFKTRKGKEESKPKEFKVTKDMAAGQGFDNFVKINFDDLKKKTVPLSFGVLSKMGFYSFKGYKKSDPEKNVIQFGIDLSSFFLRVFTNELVLEYDVQSRQILSYRGLSNLLTDKGETQDVLIKYQTNSETTKK